MAKAAPSSPLPPSPWGRQPWSLVDPPGFFRNGPRWSWRVRIPDHYFNLWILLEGSVELHLRGRAFSCDRPAMFLLPPGERVQALNTDRNEVLNFTLHIAKSSLAPWLRTEVGPKWWAVETRNPEELRQWCEAVVRHATRGGPAGAELALTLARAVFLRFWADAHSPPPDSRVERLHTSAELMAIDPGRAWSIEAVARSLGLSPGRFTQVFRELHGLPPKAWLSRCRMQRARRLLAESDAPIQQIAEDVGYSDLFFFSRHFKRHVGTSPLAWRRASQAR